jgi:hypothetical protein
MLTRKHVTEVEVHLFAAEASDLYDACPDFRVGWPRLVSTSLGNGQPFQRISKRVDDEGDVLYVRYRQCNGCIDLKVFND